ncbi:MAG: hypothetical protein EOO63_09655 [Hymenobacter sp.]|nr:MAG: hypothetical protein EOO63_09655 [Hymenobacter sp.]
MLAVLSITYLPFSLHNFYLGYYGRGVLAIALLLVGIACFALGLGGLFLGGTTLEVIAYVVGVALLLGWAFWQLSDLLRIITGHLTPRDGEYTPKKTVPGPAGLPSR